MVRTNIIVVDALVVLDVGVLRQDVVHDGLTGGLLVVLRWLLGAVLLSMIQLLLLI